MSVLLRFFFATMVICLVVQEFARAQYWMQKGGSLTVDEGYDIFVDGSGNTYTTGYFTGTASFGSTSLTASGSTDIFVVKTDDQGAIQWARKAGGSGSDRGLSIAADGSGNCYVTGYFSGTATFDTASRTSAGLQDIFIAKYNSSGDLQWVKQAGGSSADIGNGIALDNSGNPIVTGEFKGDADFGSLSLTSSSSSTDVFTCKMTPAGAFTWVEQGAGVNTDRGVDVACDGSGNIYITGQFSGNITFDVAHTNSMFNVIFVVKYNSSGAEQWFRLIGAASSNIANSIACDGSNIYLTGDFTGTVTFFGTTNTNLTNTFTNRIFVAKYNSSGTLGWATSAGSDSDLTSRSIAVDGSGNSYIVGHFKCRLDEYSDEYGEATFNSVGFSDIFVSKYNGSGAWQYSRNVGSRDDDFGYGVAVNSDGNIHFTGSYSAALNIPTSTNFVNATSFPDASCSGNSPYCSDPDYGKYRKLNTAGNSDVVIANCFDPAREPYDYYKRSGSGCDRDILSVCIDPNCPDTVTACSILTVQAITNMCPNIGPALDYQWLGAGNQPTATYTTSGIKWVIQTTDDGCFSTSDSIYVEIITVPKPSISDDVVVNTNALFPTTINVCGPDTITLTGGNFSSGYNILWQGTNLPSSGVADTSITITWTGIFNFTVSDTSGCSNTTTIQVNIYDPLDSFDLELHTDDTIEVCEGEAYGMWLYDSVANPTGAFECFTNLPYVVSTLFTVTPATGFSEGCETGLNLMPADTGLYTISAMVVRTTPCDTDTHYVTRTVYVELLPKPVVPPFFITISGSSYFCPGDSTLLVASGGPNYSWSTGSNNDSVYVSEEGIYTVSCTICETNSFGCTDCHTSFTSKFVWEKPQPVVSASSLLICPNDSVKLTCSNTGGVTGYFWEGPNGPISSNTSFIYVTDPGQYFCLFNDGDSCGLVSNTITLQQYTTPQITSIGNAVLCNGDSATISVVANEGSTIEWLPPLSGSDPVQTVYEPGTYTCKITACNIITFATVVIQAPYVEASITVNEQLCLNDTITLFGNPGMDTYEWSPGGQQTQNLNITDSGTYILTTTDTSGCIAISDPVHITIDQVPTVISIDTITTFCEGDSVILVGNDSMQTYFWSPFGDTTQSLVVYTPGEVILTTLDTNGCTGADSITLHVPSTYAPLEIIGDTMFCEGGTVILRARGKGIATYIWNPGNYIGKDFIVDTTGTYSLMTIDTFGCEAFSRNVQVYMEPNLFGIPIASDTLICEGTSVTLTASVNQGELQWYDETGQTFLGTGFTFTTPPLTSNTVYYVWSTLSLCSSTSTPVLVEVQNCESIDIPNVLTPNADGINDIFRIRLNEHKCFNCKIYNRWGVLIYELTDIRFGWDGVVTNTGEPASEGTYFYVVEYCKFTGEQFVQQGTVTLIREPVK